MIENEEIRIGVLDLDTISPKTKEDPLGGAVYLIIGPSGSGKSVLIKDLMFAKRHFIPSCVAVSETEEVNHTYQKHIPPLFIYSKMIPNLMGNIQNRQRISKQNLPNPWLTLVLDDCMNKSSNFTDDDQIALFKISRHFNMYVLISCQHSLDLKPALRDNCAGVFILRHDNEKNREKIYTNFASVIPNRKMFDSLMSELSSDYTAMFIDMRNPSQNWQDKIKWYKARDLSEFGDWSATSLDVQQYNDERYNPDYDDIYLKIAQMPKRV
jgi:hypothetical protein